MQGRSIRLSAFLLLGAVLFGTPVRAGQSGSDEPSRTGEVTAQQAEKAAQLQPYVPHRAEALFGKIEQYFVLGNLRWHPFFESAYLGGGLTGGLGYYRHVSAYNTLDVRGSVTIRGYKLIEAEFKAPRLFERRAELAVHGGWREATRVGFYGLGTAATSLDDQSVYGFQQPYLSTRLAVRPTRGAFVLGGGVEYSQWKQRPGNVGSDPSVEDRYAPAELPGLGASPTYLQLQGSAALDWRPAAGYARRGGYYGVTARNYIDHRGPYSFRQIDLDFVQHVPIHRDAWVLSLRGRLETTSTSGGDVVPFFMMPSLGGGSTLRGFRSWRFRDRHGLLLSAEWRVLVNSFVDTAVFYDAGTVTSRRGNLDLRGLKSNFGLGVRLHGAASTPIRVDLARSNEGLMLVLSTSAVF